MIKRSPLLTALLVLTPLAARAQEDVSALLQRQTQEAGSTAWSSAGKPGISTGRGFPAPPGDQPQCCGQTRSIVLMKALMAFFQFAGMNGIWVMPTRMGRMVL